MKHAIVVLAAVFLLAACGGSQPTPRSSGPITVQAVAPKGSVEWPFTFTWKGNVPAGAICRVSVSDVAERPLLQRDTKDSQLPAPEDLRLLLATTRRFLWRVSVLDENGNEVAQSASVDFEVR